MLKFMYNGDQTYFSRTKKHNENEYSFKDRESCFNISGARSAERKMGLRGWGRRCLPGAPIRVAILVYRYWYWYSRLIVNWRIAQIIDRY